MVDKNSVLGTLILAALAMSSISVMGILQSSERVPSSGIITRPAPETPYIPPTGPSPPPPEPTIEIDVYADSECTTELSSVVWGEIIAGGSVQRTIYIKNNGDAGVVLSLQAQDWSPSTADDYMTLSWSYNGSTLQSGQVMAVTLTLSVSAGCPELSSFNFDIVIIGS